MRQKRTNCTFNQGYMCAFNQNTQTTTNCYQAQSNQQNTQYAPVNPCVNQVVGNMNYGNTTYETLPPIVTSSKNVVNTYHVQKQPYIHNYHTEVVHHHIKQAEFIPNYTCSETNVTNC